MAIKDRFIPKEEFMRLLFTKIDGVDTLELSMWLKSQTDDEWVVVPRKFCTLMVSAVKSEFTPQILPYVKEMQLVKTLYLEPIKKYL